MDRQKQVRVVSVSQPRTVLQFKKDIPGSGHDHAGAAGTEAAPDLHRDIQVDIFLLHLASVLGQCPWVFASMTGVDDDSPVADSLGRRGGRWRG